MLILFGLSWPFNIYRSWHSRTAKGNSTIFELFIIAGYLCGIAGKIIGGNVTYVVAVYVLDVSMVCVDYALTLRNKRLDEVGEVVLA